jgi:hypothetical protein
MSLCCLLTSGILSSEAQQSLPLKKGKKELNIRLGKGDSDGSYT